jgi:hypothetical protein
VEVSFGYGQGLGRRCVGLKNCIRRYEEGFLRFW